MDIGEKIRNLRQKNQLTQEELADRCNLSKGYISQLENDLTSPSIASLVDILNALGTTLGDFFQSDDEQIVFGEGDYITKDNGTYGITWLVPASQKNEMEPVLLTLPPGGETGRDLPHEGEEFGYVLAGGIRLNVGKREFTVQAGGSFYYRAAATHSIRNESDTDIAEILWLTSPPNF